MKEEIKDKLRNAGFSIREDYWDAALYCLNKPYSIFVATEVKKVRVYRCEKMNPTDYEFTDLEELNKICYSTLRKDLDFEKKSYTWENCVKPGGYYVRSDSSIDVVSNDFVTDEERNLCQTKTSAISILATTQLMQICAKINEDFEPEYGDAKYYPVLYNGNLEYNYSSIKLNQFPMNSEDAVMALIESNPDLLKQYFEA